MRRALRSGRDLLRGGFGGDQALAGEVVQDGLGRLLDRLVAGVHDDLGVLVRLVGIADAGELLDLANVQCAIQTSYFWLLIDRSEREVLPDGRGGKRFQTDRV